MPRMWSTRPLRALSSATSVLVLHFVAGVVACSEGDAGVRQWIGPTLPDSVFERVATISLEEGDTVINVTPDVVVQDDGSFLIVDGREARVRIYDASGRLEMQFGRKGEGPGEFGLPLTAMRNADGTMTVVDFSRGLLDFDSSGTGFLGASRPPIRPVYTARRLSDSLFLVAGIVGGSSSPRRLLHVWNSAADTISTSFFPTPGGSLAGLASRNFGWVDIALRGDTVAAVSAFSDTVYLFAPTGRPLGRIPLPIQEFRRLQSYNPNASPAEFDEWLASLHLLVDVHWMDDRTFLVQYQRPRGEDNEWNLLRTTTSGRRHFDLRNTPKLLAVDGQRLIFVNPDSPTPNQWIVVRLR